MKLNDTIAAISSAAGPAARMIVRASGPDCGPILNQICPGEGAASRRRLFVDGMIVPVWAYCFTSPHSYTGDDLFELHIPGNPLLAGNVLDRLISLGARHAEPGEFTARAYFNGRIDLSQAEGVAAVVAAGNEAELAAGRRLMAGELTRRLRPWIDQLADALALIEAEIDFSDQGTRFVSDDELNARLNAIAGQLGSLLSQSARLSRLSHEPRIVLAGRPNAGKSTLLNALSKTMRAVVSPIAGTTRDALSAEVALERGIVRLVDVAGLESHENAGGIAAQMQSRARIELERADAVILVRDATDDRPALELSRRADLTVCTKIDLLPHGAPHGDVAVSAVANIGMETLRASLDRVAFGSESSGIELALSNRHVQAIAAAGEAIERARGTIPPEIMAAELRQALDSLGQVCGDITPDDILGRIFASFCIGK